MTKGRAEAIRLAFHCGGIPFADERLSREQFAEKKETFPFGQVPVLTVDDKAMIPQEVAILHYVGRHTGLYPNDAEEAVKVDVLINVANGNIVTLSLILIFVSSKSLVLTLNYPCDVTCELKSTDFYSSMSVFYMPDNPGKEHLKKMVIEDKLPKLFGYLEKYLAKNGTTFSAGSKLTIADLRLYSIISSCQSGLLDGCPTDLVDKYPHVIKLYQAIDGHEKVASWNKNQTK
jgi:glutathione S-transferase